MNISHVEIYQEDLENGVMFKEVTCTDKGVYVETLTFTFDSNGHLYTDYNMEKIV